MMEKMNVFAPHLWKSLQPSCHFKMEQEIKGILQPKLHFHRFYTHFYNGGGSADTFYSAEPFLSFTKGKKIPPSAETVEAYL